MSSHVCVALRKIEIQTRYRHMSAEAFAVFSIVFLQHPSHDHEIKTRNSQGRNVIVCRRPCYSMHPIHIYTFIDIFIHNKQADIIIIINNTNPTILSS
jgi:hypothetical protein